MVGGCKDGKILSFEGFQGQFRIIVHLYYRRNMKIGALNHLDLLMLGLIAWGLRKV